MKRIVISRFGLGVDKLAFDLTFEVSQTNYHVFHRPLRPSSEKYLTEVGEAGALVVRTILGLPGITEVGIEPYQITVQKGSAFDWIWEEINLKTKALEAITNTFGETDEVIDNHQAEVIAEAVKRLGQAATG